MKTFAKSLMVGGMLLTAGAVSAAPVISISYDPNAEADFKALLNPYYATEDFNSLPVQGTGSQYHAGVGQAKQQLSWEDSSPSFTTNVGTFTLMEPGQTYTNEYLDENDGDNLKIESLKTGEFGREALAGGDPTDFWLDSNDAKIVNWDFDSGDVVGKNYNAFGFYLADPSDIKAALTLRFSDGSSYTQTEIPFEQDNATVGYVTVKSSLSIVGGTLVFENREPGTESLASNDGWGIDDITVGRLPEPGTLLLMGLGLLGLGAARRRVAK